MNGAARVYRSSERFQGICIASSVVLLKDRGGVSVVIAGRDSQVSGVLIAILAVLESKGDVSWGSKDGCSSENSGLVEV